MSVFIPGMEMPQGKCEWVDKDRHLHRCKLLNGDDDCKMQEGICADATWEEQFANCPLVEVKVPHGDLIDRGELQSLIVNLFGKEVDFIQYAPIVIGAEGSGE